MFVFIMTYLKSVHTVMLQPIASTINTLLGTLYQVFSILLWMEVLIHESFLDFI
ncbi:hypothetical protein HanXRQr2_Chr11g0501301 [Helianthus annuus]|uniref:Uncharacterized protein n=1 Tax=Helianthus annuus TaxID=4232 RepID=A0A251TMZ0_HELAN|nr:hypothetical protein HanXRQr2_Chr11g0501301 [Helianthus annuus]KAJ0875977.1 hypothetical protein HanPSC8_Chr11g0483101 [Helianthus annuus]